MQDAPPQLAGLRSRRRWGRRHRRRASKAAAALRVQGVEAAQGRLALTTAHPKHALAVQGVGDVVDTEPTVDLQLALLASQSFDGQRGQSGDRLRFDNLD